MKQIFSILLTCVIASSAFALPSKHRPILAHGKGAPLYAWVEFCSNLNYREECLFDTNEPRRIALTDEVWFKLAAINIYVNRVTTSITDIAHWGEDVADRWNLAEDGYGDCEDHQLLKRKLLAANGIPRRAMRMTFVMSNEGGHAVLMVKTDRGDFILDNLTNEIRSWEETPYSYVKQESQVVPNEWVYLHPENKQIDFDTIVSSHGKD